MSVLQDELEYNVLKLESNHKQQPSKHYTIPKRKFQLKL